MTFRYARHTNNLEQLKSFYIDVLGLELLGGFENHDGYNGVFLGKQDENWHLEFTQSDEIANHTFDDDDLLVFYPNSKLEFELLKEKLEHHSIQFVKSKNPYWNENGIQFLDPDGFGIVISHLNLS
ncbi:VOC family protein [Flavobacterium sp.]|jgi:catechol 2,3-dioxygenase-like lactoylglutathione lyase family enzyme|uniref:VOC family protein n=1 Tax=Flavobacterium sp. TaxID=239 RepID=UPI0037BFC094